MSTLEVNLHPAQMEVFKDKHQFRILVAGRRFGKTWLCAYIMLVNALQKPNGRYFIISPSYFQTKLMWEMVVNIAPREYVEKIMLGDLYIQFTNGARVYAKSGDNPHVLRGVGLDGVIFDETAQIQEVVWEEVIEPALIDRNGWAVFIGTPRGKNWFYKLYLRGFNDEFKDFKSFHFTTGDNPFIPADYIEKKKKTLPEIIFRQEIMGEFLEGGGTVFRKYDTAIWSKQEKPIDGEFYIIGVDLGRHEDFTVIKVGKTSELREVYRERFNQSNWDYIKERIRFVHRRYNNGTIFMDSTGMGDPIYEDLAQEGIPIYGVNLNVKSKPMLIENLQLAIENALVGLIDDDNSNLEHNAYTYTILPTGNIRYNAPPGWHDDEVISTALMVYGMSGGTSSTLGLIEEDDGNYDVYDEMESPLDWDSEDNSE